MNALRLVLLLVSLAVCYLLFFKSVPAAAPDAGPAAHSQYKQAMDKANDAASQMQAQHAETEQP